MEINPREINMRQLGSEGGKARAARLSKEERSGIARQAAIARWGTNLPSATHGDPHHPLRIGNIEIPCYVLDSGQRVISQRGLQSSVGMYKSGGAQRLLQILVVFASKGVDCKDLPARIESPIMFLTPHGPRAHGYEATILADLCDVFLAARRAGALHSQQHHIAEQCEILVRGFARVGIIALIDEATGYQDVRDRQALQEILDKFLRKEFAAWAKTFPDEFYREIFRLRGWPWRGMKINRPQCVASYTKDVVYARLAPGILKELETRNPIANGRRKSKHFQWLTEDIGHPALAQHLHAVIGLMRAAEDWHQFKRMIDRAFPRREDSRQLRLFDDDMD